MSVMLSWAMDSARTRGCDPTGVDTDRFDRDRVSPTPGLAEDTVHLLFVARLTAQKDPLLMVEVARELRDRGLPFCIHVIGGGELEQEVRARVAEYGLDDRSLL